jgi:glycosyltransferase involved in cell wall biosynthesis
MRCPTLTELPPPLPGKSGWPWTQESRQLRGTMPDGRPWPRISIVTPSYNQGRFIEETIRSVLLQGYPNLEYIVMDGGSKDNSAEIIRKYESWLTYWRTAHDGGQSAGIAEGFQRSTGEIMAWLNSDDRYLPGTLHKVGKAFSSNRKLAFINSDINVIDECSRFSHRFFVSRPCGPITANLGYHTWPQQGCFWRRYAYENVGGVDPSLEFCMDRDLFIRLVSVGPSARLKGPPTAEYRFNKDSKSETMTDLAKRENILLLQRYSSVFGRGPSPNTGLLLLTWWYLRACGSIRKRLANLGLEL